MKKELSQKFYKKAQKWAKILGNFSSIEAIFLSGSLARGDFHTNSDIDFFIITVPGRIWTARFFCFFLLKIFGQLAKPHNHSGKICPNHFISKHSLEIREQDLYAAKLFSSNIPLYDPFDIFPHFVHKNKKWINEKGFSFQFKTKKETVDKNFSDSFFSQEKKLSWFQKFQEKCLKKVQIWKIQQNPDFQKKGACIVLENDELRFHPDPKNKKYTN